MNHIRYLAIGATLLVALAAPAQQTATGASATDKAKHEQRAAPSDVSIVEQQLKVLTGKLALNGEQQAKFRPILQALHEATEKLVQDKSLTREERMAKARPEFYNADKQMRELLSDDQKKKLDAYEQSPHPEMHGNLDGETESAAPTAKN